MLCCSHLILKKLNFQYWLCSLTRVPNIECSEVSRCSTGQPGKTLRSTYFFYFDQLLGFMIKRLQISVKNGISAVLIKTILKMFSAKYECRTKQKEEIIKIYIQKQFLFNALKLVAHFYFAEF